MSGSSPLALLAACSFLWIAAAAPASAQLPRQTVRELELTVDRAPYNQLVRSGRLYLVKDRDFDREWPQQGIRTAWLYVPPRDEAPDRLELRADYCLKGLAAATTNTYLQRIDLIEGERVLVSMEDGIGAQAAADPVLAPQAYAQNPYDTRQVASGVFVYPPRYYYSYPFPTYHLNEDCASDLAGFDLAPIANALARLPEKSLGLRLHFSNGLVSNWGINGTTIQALKRLLQVRRDNADRRAEQAEEPIRSDD